MESPDGLLATNTPQSLHRTRSNDRRVAAAGKTGLIEARMTTQNNETKIIVMTLTKRTVQAWIRRSDDAVSRSIASPKVNYTSLAGRTEIHIFTNFSRKIPAATLSLFCGSNCVNNKRRLRWYCHNFFFALWQLLLCNSEEAHSGAEDKKSNANISEVGAGFESCSCSLVYQIRYKIRFSESIYYH